MIRFEAVCQSDIQHPAFTSPKWELLSPTALQHGIHAEELCSANAKLEDVTRGHPTMPTYANIMPFGQKGGVDTRGIVWNTLFESPVFHALSRFRGGMWVVLTLGLKTFCEQLSCKD